MQLERRRAAHAGDRHEALIFFLFFLPPHFWSKNKRELSSELDIASAKAIDDGARIACRPRVVPGANHSSSQLRPPNYFSACIYIGSHISTSRSRPMSQGDAIKRDLEVAQLRLDSRTSSDVVIHYDASRAR